ncbi:MAG: hypothetical protein U0R49_10905 [Fimbriimonadales bacterium]
MARLRKEFGPEHEVVLPEATLKMYRDGYSDGDRGMDARLRPGFPVGDLSVIETNFIGFATPEVARFILGSYLVALVNPSGITPPEEAHRAEVFCDQLLMVLGGNDISSRDRVLKTFSLLSDAQRELVADCLRFVISHQMYGWEEATTALQNYWREGALARKN